MKNKLKIALAQLNPLVGDAVTNANKLIKLRSSLDDAYMSLTVCLIELDISPHSYPH